MVKLRGMAESQPPSRVIVSPPTSPQQAASPGNRLTSQTVSSGRAGLPPRGRCNGRFLATGEQAANLMIYCDVTKATGAQRSRFPLYSKLQGRLGGNQESVTNKESQGEGLV